MARNSRTLWGGKNQWKRGERLLEFAHRHKMTPANTLLSSQDLQKTWHSFDGVTLNEIETQSSQYGASSPVSAELRPEHFRARISTLITTWLWWLWSRNWRKTCRITAQDSSSTLKTWQTPASSRPVRSNDWRQVCRAFNLLEERIDSLTGNIHGACIDTASQVLDKARKKRSWMTDGILDLCNKRRRSFNKRRNDDLVAKQNHSATTKSGEEWKRQRKTWPRLAVLHGKTKPLVFLWRLNSTNHSSILRYR